MIVVDLKVKAEKDVDFNLHLVSDLSLHINLEESHLTPEYIAAILMSRKARPYRPQDKIDMLLELTNKFKPKYQS